MLRALWADVRSQKVVQGGSTITQQFVKNSCVSDQRSIARKLKEAALAWQLEQRWSKDRILTAYLNTIYFGNGAYGVAQAAQTYFHRRAMNGSLAQAALPAGIPQAPSLYDPVTNPAAALVAIDPRTGRVLAMVGGNNFRKSQFNLAVQGERQPGSSFKPFVLATALKQGISPDTTFVSGPVSIPLGDRVWYVHNYEN